MVPRYLLFSEPVIPDFMEIHCPSCGGRWKIASDSAPGVCKCGETFIVDMPIIQSGLYCWTQAFRERGGVGEQYPTIERDYLEKYDIVHVNYTPGHPNYIESIRNALGDKTSVKLVANVDYAMSMWETLNPFNMKRQLNMADLVFHVESMGAHALGRFLGRYVPIIPHPVDTRHIKQMPRSSRDPHAKPLVTCQWHRYGGTWSSYYFGTLGLNCVKFLTSFTPPNPQKLVNLETLFERVIPAMPYEQYLQTVLSMATANMDLAPDITYGRGIVDAAAFGIPTVGSESVEASRVIWPELTVPAFNHSAVHETTKKLLTDKEFYDKMATQGRDRSELYSCESSYYKMMEALYG